MQTQYNFRKELAREEECDGQQQQQRAQLRDMIEVVLNDRLVRGASPSPSPPAHARLQGKKIRVKCKCVVSALPRLLCREP